MKNWSNRDWVWTVGILISIIIIILTWRLNDNSSVVNIISMFASGASIVLAIVAIGQSTIYNASSNELYTRMTEKLSILENNMELVKENILNNAREVIDSAPIEENIKEDMKLNLVSINKDEFFRNREVALSYMFEKTIYDKIKDNYSDKYDVKITDNMDRGVDIMLENSFKIIPIEIKITSIARISVLAETIKYINSFRDKISKQTQKEIISVLIIISDDVSYPNLIDKYMINDRNSYIKIVHFTKLELQNISNEKFKKRIGI